MRKKFQKLVAYVLFCYSVLINFKTILDYKAHENIRKAYISLVEAHVCSLNELTNYNTTIAKDAKNFLEHIEETICDYYGSRFPNLFIEVSDWVYKNRNLDPSFQVVERFL